MTHSARFLPTLEVLEDRLVPALTIRQVGTVIRIKGEDSLNDFIQIGDSGTSANGAVTIVANGQFRSSTGAVTRIRVRTGNGNDVVQYSLLRTLTTGNGRRIDIDVGDGNDNVTILLASGLQTRTGLDIQAHLGAGTDTFLLNSSGASVPQNAVLQVDVFGGSGKDTSTLNYSGRVDGVLRIRNRGEADYDRLEVNGGPGSGSTGFMSVRLMGGDAADVLFPNIQKGSVFDTVRLDLVADGGPDFDVCVLAQGQGFVPVNCESTPRR